MKNGACKGGKAGAACHYSHDAHIWEVQKAAHHAFTPHRAPRPAVTVAAAPRAAAAHRPTRVTVISAAPTAQDATAPS